MRLSDSILDMWSTSSTNTIYEPMFRVTTVRFDGRLTSPGASWPNGLYGKQRAYQRPALT